MSNCYYYCTCSSDRKKKNQVNCGRTPFREVPVDDEGICYFCGFYAVAYYEKIDPEQGKLYDKLYSTGVEWKPKRVKGGASLKIQKELKKRKMRGSSKQSENGNMDV